MHHCWFESAGDEIRARLRRVDGSIETWLPWIGACADQRDNFAPLSSRDWQVHVCGEATPELRSRCALRHLALHGFPWRDDISTTGLQANAAYLVRPDGYVALADPDQRADTLAAYLDARTLTPRQRVNRSAAPPV